MKRLAREHPVFRDLPQEVQDSLAVPPGEWRDLPFNKRWRKRMKRDGVVAHVYAGPNEGQLWQRHFNYVEVNQRRSWRLMCFVDLTMTCCSTKAPMLDF